MMSNIKVVSAKDVKKQGAGEVGRESAQYLHGCDWIVAHLDVDVFDPTIMPGVNFPEPGGLIRDDVLDIFRALNRTGKLKAVDLAAFNPTRDVDNKGRSLLIDLAPELIRPT